MRERKPILGSQRTRTAATDLDRLLTALDTTLINLAEQLIGAGQQLVVGEIDMPRLYYILVGEGRMTFMNGDSAALRPHTLIIVPPNQSVGIEMPIASFDDGKTNVRSSSCGIERYRAIPGGSVAPDIEAELILICACFRVTHGHTIEIFKSNFHPVVEQFQACDRIDLKLKESMVEITRQGFGTGAMTAALMKQVFVTLFRRAMESKNVWVDYLSAVGDAQVSRALADMISRPGAAHSVQSLSQTAGLSRSAFMDRFSNIFERSPITVLRDLRMRQAVLLLASYQVDQVAHMVGYANRSSFCRAFQKFYGDQPSNFKVQSKNRSCVDLA